MHVSGVKAVLWQRRSTAAASSVRSEEGALAYIWDPGPHSPVELSAAFSVGVRKFVASQPLTHSCREITEAVHIVLPHLVPSVPLLVTSKHDIETHDLLHGKTGCCSCTGKKGKN